MSVEWFDLAQRLYAAETGRPVARLAHTTFTPSASALAVRATVRGGSVSVSAAAVGGGEETACDEAGLALLARLGGTLAADAPAMLLTDDGGTIPALVGLARAHAHHSDPNISGSAAMVGWWADRADHPGTSAVVNLPAASSARYVLGVVPEAQRSARVWRTWLQITGESVAGMHEWARAIGSGPLLPLLAAIGEDDAYSFSRAQSALVDGHDWSRPDNTASAAMGLRSRCDAADVMSSALLDDPMWRERALHTGHVAVGVASMTPPPKGSRRRNGSLSVTCERLDSRLRVGSAVTGWGRHTATATVRAVHRRGHIDRGCRREVGARTRFGGDVCAAEWRVGGVDAASGVTFRDARWSWPVLAALPRSAVLAFDGADTRPFPA